MSDEAQTAQATLSDATTLGADESATTAVGLLPGAMIGRYRLINMIGAGAMGVVWSADDPQLERKVAIKVVHPALARAHDASARLLREARAMAKLSHRSVVTVHDAGESDGQLFLAMELVNGTTLGAMLRSRSTESPADWPRWLAMIVEAGRGLAAAHDAGVLHRDFKPDNVLVDSVGRVCVGDFGLATLGDVSRSNAGNMQLDAGVELTMTGALMGTPIYMSPQQLRGELVDASADQFSFCVAVYEVLYGHRPFSTEAIGYEVFSALEHEIETRRVAPPPEGSTVPDALRTAILRGLAPEPADRWPDMTALLHAIEDAHAPLEQGSVPGSDDSPMLRRRGRAIIAFAIACGVVAVGLAIVAVSRQSAPAGSSEPMIPRRLFSVPLASKLALSPNGDRIAIAADRIEIRDLTGSGNWTRAIGSPTDQVGHLELTSEWLRFGVFQSPMIDRWAYASDGSDTPEPAFDGPWYGSLGEGELIGHGDRELTLVRAGKVIQTWPITGEIQVWATSADKQWFAYLESERFYGTIVVFDLAHHIVLRSKRLLEPVGLSWISPGRLAYSTGTLDRPTLWRVDVSASGFGLPEVLYTTPVGWFTRITARADVVYFVDAHPSTRARILKRGDAGTSTQDFEPSQLGAGLGWTADDMLLSWNRATQRVERRMSSRTGESIGVELDGEPANATLAGDMLIVALRRSGGRELVGISLARRRIVWRIGDRGVIVARCAADSHPPCFALRRDDAFEDQLVTFDPVKGELGDKPILQGTIDDIAVDEGGEHLLVVDRSPMIREIDRLGVVQQKFHVPFDTTRGVAYDPAGGILVAGTVTRTTYQVGRLFDGGFSPLLQSDTDILSLVRSSHDGKQISILGRTFSPDLMKLPLLRRR